MDIEQELASHRDATLRAIESGRVDLAKRRLEAYVNFAEAFLEAATKEGIKFSQEYTRSVSFLDWPTATQIIEGAYDGIMAAVKSDNHEIIANAASLPIQFMRMSVQKEDFLFYHRMIRIYPHMLWQSYNLRSASTRDTLVNQSWRYLRDFTVFSLTKLLENKDENIQRRFILLVLWTFSDLMKVALDHDDVSTFGMLGRELNMLFDHLNHHSIPNNNEGNSLPS